MALNDAEKKESYYSFLYNQKPTKRLASSLINDASARCETLALVRVYLNPLSPVFNLLFSDQSSYYANTNFTQIQKPSLSL